MNISDLEKIIENLPNANPLLIKTLERLKISYNPSIANKLLFYLQNTLHQDSDLPFTYPNQELDGVLNLGTIIGSDLHFRIPFDYLNMHTLVAGSSGFGKTTFGLNLLYQILRNTNYKIHVIDPKADEYTLLCKYFPDIIVLNWSDLRLNPFAPPPNMSKIEWFQITTSHFAQTYNFWEGAESLLIEKLSITDEIPLPQELLNRLKSKREYDPKKAAIKSTIVSRLEILNLSFGEVINTDSDMLEQLFNKNYILKTSGLMSENDSYLTEHILLWDYYYRLNN